MTRPRATPAKIRHRLAVAALLAAAACVQAGIVRTLDGRTLEGELRFDDRGALVVQPATGDATTVELKNIISAIFASGTFFSSGSTLPNGWTAQDFGETRGFARLDEDTLTLRAEGQTTNATACHLVGRAMPSDGQIVMRVEEVGGNGVTHAGVMIRGHNNSSAFASLALGNDGQLWFHRRLEADKKEIRLSAGPRVAVPVWLRLQKRDKTVTALYSTDGAHWQTVGSDSVKLMPERTWRESEGELQLVRASCGAFISSRGKDTRGRARILPVNMALHGLLGEYFTGQDFNNLRMARLDPQVRFNWNHSPPDPAVGTNFSVRWTGRLIAPRSAGYGFHCEASGPVRLWLDDEEAAVGGYKRPEEAPTAKPVWLVAGRGMRFKMEFESGLPPASIKLGWAVPGKKPDMIDMTNFISVFTGARSPESVAFARATNSGPGVRGVLLRNGTFISGTVTRADVSAVRVSFAGRNDAPVLNSWVARIILRPPRIPLPFEIAQGRRGVFLKNGDFFEGEFRGIESGALQMSSVLYGLKRFGGDSEPLVVVLNDPAPPASGFAVRLLDGSSLHSANVSATADRITIAEPVLGTLAVPVTELVEIRRLDADGKN